MLISILNTINLELQTFFGFFSIKIINKSDQIDLESGFVTKKNPLSKLI